jgi:hypothetical protein
MTDIALKDVFRRAEAWPEEDQRKLVQAALIIENQHAAEFELTAADWRIIDARMEAARNGDIASDQEVEAFFAKYRSA